MNTFGPSLSQQYPLIDPQSVRNDRVRFKREYLPLLDKANSFYAPTGRWPCRGFILLDRASYNNLNPYQTDFQLNIGDTTSPNNIGTLYNISIVQAQCVTRGLANDPNAIYLIELTDTQGILYNKWFQAGLTAQYNIRAPAYPQTFYPWSLNGGTTWTWDTMLQDIWGKMSAVVSLGPWSGLPLAPAGTPEGFWFTGVLAWPAFIDILEYLNMTVAVDLTNASAPYRIVQVGASDTAFTALQAKYSGNLEDDLEWQDFGASRAPANVVVVFRRRNQVYGTEETVRYDSPFQWESTSYYTVTVRTPALQAVGSHMILSDFTVEYDIDGNPLASDVAIANTIAQERASQYYNRVALGYLTQTYAGALPFVTGSLLDGVCWYQDYRNPKTRDAWCTKIVRGGFPLRHELWDDRGIAL